MFGRVLQYTRAGNMIALVPLLSFRSSSFSP